MDLKHPEEIKLLRSILNKADVLIENFKPGSLAKLGLDPNKLREDNPKLITCSISGYGSRGEWAKMKAYDLLIQAETGMASITGTADAPGRVGVSVADIAAGMYSWAAILEALIARGISGRGRHIEVSLFDALADWMAVPLLWQDYGGKAPERVGLSHPSICPYGAFKTADGKTLLLSIQNEREWIRFCADILDDADFADQYPDNSSRLSNRSVVDKRVAAVLGKMLHAEIAAKLKKSEIAYGTLNDMQGFSTHPVLRRVEISNPEGSIRFPAPPAIFNNKLTETLGDVPELNQHGEAIRAEFAKTSPKD